MGDKILDAGGRLADNPCGTPAYSSLGESVRTNARIGHGGRRCLVPLTAIVAAATFSHGSSAWGQCSNDAGAGDTDEGEACLLDETDDTTNGGCNSSPAVFTDVAADGGLPRTYCSSASNYNKTETCDEDGDCPAGDTCNIGTGLCEGPSQPSVSRRDTDWYLISQAELTLADTDGNGTVRIISSPVAETGIDLVTFFITVDDLVTCTASVESSVGCYNSSGQIGFDPGTNAAQHVFTISENPSGIIVFVAPGLCTGAGIFDGLECSTGLNDYTVTIEMDPIFEAGDFTACGDPAQNPLLGPCHEPNPGVNGCADAQCCVAVCTALPQCCFNELGWTQQCANASITVGCVAEDGLLYCIATGPDSSADGYCKICPGWYGSWTSDAFGGFAPGYLFWGDGYNPIGGAGPPALDLQEASFTNGFYFFQRDSNGNGLARELLTNIIGWQQFFAPDDSVELQNLSFGFDRLDTNNDGVWDQLTSWFNLRAADLDLDFQLTQQLGISGSVAVMTQTLDITNNHPDPVDFTLVRSMDGDLVWDAAADPADDTVGTGANGSGCRYVFQGESGLPGTYVTISSPQADVYFGAKAGVDPDGAGPCPPMAAGSDLPLWDAYGVPCAWENYIAGVGADVNGESGPAPPGCTPPCDASIGLSIPVSLDPGASTTVVVYTTYGAASPLGAICDPPPCPWDCGDFDGIVGILDFLAILAQWGQVGTPCDFDGGGVGINDFLALLANWGPCIR